MCTEHFRRHVERFIFTKEVSLFFFFFLKNNQDCVFCAIISFLATVNDNAFHIYFMIYWRVSLITFGAFYLVSIIFSAS